jgi:anti-anti-sigma factor
MEIKVSTENGRVPVIILQVDGSIDSSTAAIFKAKANELIKGGGRYFLIDLSEAPFISSTGLGVLHDIFNQLRQLHPDANLNEQELRRGISAGTYKSPHLKLLNLSSRARSAFEMAGFDMYIETFTDRAKAIASF